MKLTRRETVAGALSVGLAQPLEAHVPPVWPPRGRLSNPRASTRAARLYTYLWSQYGTHTLTGQMESNFSAAGARAELDYVEKVTGKLPAILGLDYIDPSDVHVNDRAASWYLEGGGIVTLCWHWGVPDIGSGYENAKKDFDVFAASKPGTAKNKAMMRDLAWCADRLTELRDLSVPVLWRPFHEFSGDWFWWGKHGPSAFKMLWQMMYDYFTYSRELDNLIWVLGWAGQNMDQAYYPGRRFVDVAGADIYVDDHGGLTELFKITKDIVGDSVPVCLHENGPIPDPTDFGADATWLYFMTWHTKFILDGKINSTEDIRRAYLSDRTVTKDELPDLKGV